MADVGIVCVTLESWVAVFSFIKKVFTDCTMDGVLLGIFGDQQSNSSSWAFAQLGLAAR